MIWKESKKVLEVFQQADVKKQVVEKMYNLKEDPVYLTANGKRYRIVNIDKILK